MRAEYEWLPALGINFTLRMDGFAWLFVTLISAIGFLVVLYARYYMSPEDPVPRFYSFFLGFMGAMLGVVLSGNLILLAVFWELTSIFSFLLIGYWYHNANARDGARMALTITAIGGLGCSSASCSSATSSAATTSKWCSLRAISSARTTSICRRCASSSSAP